MYLSTASSFWFSLNSAYGRSINSGEGKGGVGGGGGGSGGGEGGGKGGAPVAVARAVAGAVRQKARAVFNNQLKGAAEVYGGDDGDWQRLQLRQWRPWRR